MTPIRYFLEVSYKGSGYSGFQKQANANSIQAEVERAFAILQKSNIELTGSSRTDAGVHALQNFFHFDYTGFIHPQFIYKMNAILPDDIVLTSVKQVENNYHCRFNAISRTYKYFIYQKKNAFLRDRAYYFPYTIDIEKLSEAASILTEYTDFTSFSKRNTQVKTFECGIEKSEWKKEDDLLVYHVRANRFLRGMVRGLTGTMLQVGRGKISIEKFRDIIKSKDCSNADFSVPAKGLFLVKVDYPGSILETALQR
jgi:tRNA pseudouridine38-40 synthase